MTVKNIVIYNNNNIVYTKIFLRFASHHLWYTYIYIYIYIY